MACGDVRARARVAILDSELTASMPLPVARLSALDALSHALESAVCKTATGESRALSFQAFRRIEPVLEAVLTGTASAEQRAAMLVGAAFAGQAIEASMLGAGHATANPLTAHFGVAHGRAVLATLPTVMRWNAELVGEIYEAMMPGLIEWVERMRELAEFAPVVVPSDQVPQLAREASTQRTGEFNPRPLSEADFEAIYRTAVTG